MKDRNLTKHWRSNLSMLRQLNNETQARMAQRLNMSQSLINLLESGKRNFTQDMIENICQTYHVSLRQFLVLDWRKMK